MISIIMHAELTVGPGNHDRMPVVCDVIMEHLIDAERTLSVHSASVSMDRSKPAIEIELCATGGTFEEAESTAARAIREAITASGGRVEEAAPGQAQTPPLAMHNRESSELICA
jgi:hypothetical protein